MYRYCYLKVLLFFRLCFDGTTINVISRECRVVFELYGRNILEDQTELVELGWAAIQLFNFTGLVKDSSYESYKSWM